jgi:hypothetical protein
LISPTILLSVPSRSTKIILRYKEWFELESGYDRGSLKLSTDDGETWSTLSSKDGSSDWREQQIDLSAFANKKIRLAFQFSSDSSTAFQGWYVDNIQLVSFDAQPFNISMTSLNSQNFPFVYMNVAADSSGVGLNSLTQSSFSVFENTTLQTDYFQVTPPNVGGGVRLVDVVFLLDVTSSMTDYIENVRTNMLNFMNALSISGINFGVGFVVFGDITYTYNSGNFYYDTSQILSIIQNITLGEHGIGSGDDVPEDQLGAMAAGASMNYQAGAQRVEILLTDAPSHENDLVTSLTVSNLITLLKASNITVFPVFDTTNSQELAQYAPIATATNSTGSYYSVFGSFDQIIALIGNAISNTYVVRYRSSDPVLDGKVRDVLVQATHLGSSDTASASYIPGAAPSIQRSAATLALHNQAWAEGTPITIAATITDNVPPLVQSATLFYRQTGSPSYSSVPMAPQSGDIYSAAITASSVKTPGVDYYITATDGNSTSSAPKTDPLNSPYQFAILPNVAPAITHTPPSTLTPGTAVTIVATIVDNTNYVSVAKLFYRMTGQILYQNIAMTGTGGNNYQAIIPSSYVTTDGIDYYIYAVDNFGVSSTHGSPDDPHQILPAHTFVSYLTEKQGLITDILGINRPWYGTSHPFYKAIESNAGTFVKAVNDAYQKGAANQLDMEGIARLTLSERVTKQALNDAIEISQNGATGLRSWAFGEVAGAVVSHLADIVRVVPLVGEPVANALTGASGYFDNSLYKLEMAFDDGMTLPLSQLASAQASVMSDAAKEAMSDAGSSIRDFTVEQIDGSSFGPGVFDKADHMIQDFGFLALHELETTSRQQDALTYAQTHNFSSSAFDVAASDATGSLNTMIKSDNAANDVSNFTNSLSEATDIIVLIASFVLIVVTLLSSVVTGGIALIPAIAAIAAFLVTWGSFVSNVLSLTEAGESLVYVDFVMPVMFVNPSVDQAFGHTTSTPSKPLIAARTSLPKTRPLQVRNVTPIGSYYQRLRVRVVNGDPTWATTGMDSLNYYENLVRGEELAVMGDFLAAADSANKRLSDYSVATTGYMVRSAARELFAASLEIAAFVSRSGVSSSNATSVAIVALDSAIVNSDRLEIARSSIYTALQQAQIPMRGPIGMSQPDIQILSKSGGKVRVKAEVINYGSVKADGISVYLQVGPGRNSIIGDSLKTISIEPGGSGSAEFIITSQESYLTGSVLMKSAPASAGYYVLPGRAFSISLSTLSPDSKGSVGQGQTYAYPNPFNPQMGPARLRFKLGTTGSVTITIYDVSNTKVRSIPAGGIMGAGVEQTVIWNGRNDNGGIVANGVYFYVIESSAGERAVGKIAVLK